MDTHAHVRSFLFCANEDVKSSEMLNLRWRLHGEAFLARLACAPRQLFSGKEIKDVQLNKGCSCARFSPAELGAAAAALVNQTLGLLTLLFRGVGCFFVRRVIELKVYSSLCTDRDSKSSENLFLQPATGRALKWLLVHLAGWVGGLGVVL